MNIVNVISTVSAGAVGVALALALALACAIVSSGTFVSFVSLRTLKIRAPSSPPRSRTACTRCFLSWEAT